MSKGDVSLPFDQYQRYRLVADLVDRARGDRGALRILDVGGRTGLLAKFLPQDKIELVDLEPSEVGGLVLGDGSRLPFAAESFDAVVSFDTLEHVPKRRRRAFVEESWRVAKSWVIHAGPYQAKRVEEAEARLRGFLTEKLELHHRYLEEHHSHGLPKRQDVESRLRELGGEVVSVGHANIERWLGLMCLSMYMDRDAPLRGLAGEVTEEHLTQFFIALGCQVASIRMVPARAYPPVPAGAYVNLAGGDAEKVLAINGTKPSFNAGLVLSVRKQDAGISRVVAAVNDIVFSDNRISN